MNKRIKIPLMQFEGHTNSVNAVAVSPDNQLIVSGSNDKTVRVWELASGKLLRTLEGHTSSVFAVAVSPVAVSPDDQLIVSGSDDETVRVWELASGKLLRTLEGHTSSVNAVTVSPNNQLIISGSWDKTVRVWELASGKLLRTLEGHTSDVRAVGVSPDNQLIVSGSWDKTVRVWELASGKLLRTLEGHTNSVNAVAVSPDNQLIVSGSDDKTVRVWELASGKLLRTLEGHTSPVFAVGVSPVTVSPDNQLIVSGSWDKTVRVWELASGKLLRTLEGHTSFVYAVAVSPDNQLIVSGSWDKTVRVWELASGKLLRTLEGHTSPVFTVAVSSDGKYIRSQDSLSPSSDGKYIRSQDSFGEFHFWITQTGEQIKKRALPVNTVFSNLKSIGNQISVHSLAENIIIDISADISILPEPIEALIRKIISDGPEWISPHPNSYLLTGSCPNDIQAAYIDQLRMLLPQVESPDTITTQTLIEGDKQAPYQIESPVSENKLISEALIIIDSSVDGFGRVSARTLSRRLEISTSEVVSRICDLLLDNNEQLLGLLHEAGDLSTNEDDFFSINEKLSPTVSSANTPPKYVQLHRLKVFVVGEPSVGKTALKNAITGQISDKPLASTAGIDTFVLWQKVEADVHWAVYWWDFAGQHSNRDTHKLFLTQDAIYLLVLNLRESFGKNEIGYWLQSIRDKAPKASIIPILAHLDEVGTDVLGLQSKQDWSKTEKLFDKYGTNNPIKVSNTKGTNIQKVKSLLKQFLKDTSATVLPNIYLDIEKFVLAQKAQIFISMKQIIDDLSNKFESATGFSPQWARRSLEIMARQGLTLILETGSSSDIVILDVDKANKSIAKILDHASSKDGFIEVGDVVAACVDFFESQRLQEAATIMSNLLISIGLAIPFNAFEGRSVTPAISLIIPHVTKVLEANEILELVPPIFRNTLESSLTNLSKLVFKITSYDETLPARLLGQLGEFIPINQSSHIWRQDPDGRGIATRLSTVLYQGIVPSIFFVCDQVGHGKLQLTLCIQDPILAQVVYQSVIYNLGQHQVRYEVSQSFFASVDSMVDPTISNMLQETVTLLQQMNVKQHSIMDEIVDSRGMMEKHHDKLLTTTLETKQDIISRIDLMYKNLTNELDKITNKCPRLVFLDRIKGGRLTGQVMKSGLLI